MNGTHGKLGTCGSGPSNYRQDEFMGEVLDKTNQQIECQKNKDARKMGKETTQCEERVAAQF